MKRIAPEIEQAVVAAWEAGERSTRALAARHGIGIGTVRATLERNGLGKVPRAFFPKRTSAEEDAEILRQYAAGTRSSVLAEQYGLSQASILNRVHEAGIPAHKKVYIQPLDDRESALVLELRDQGLGVVEIGRQVGVAYPRVRRFLAESGLPTWSLVRRSAFRTDASGYVLFAIAPEDPLSGMANARGYVLYHRYVMAQSLGRPLTKSETVHHINGDRGDNRIENLQLRQGRHGKGAKFACLDCGSHNVGPVPLD